MSGFAILKVEPGKLNALVKNVMRQMSIKDPNEAVRRINSGEWVARPSPSSSALGTLAIDTRTIGEMLCAACLDTYDYGMDQFSVTSKAGVYEYKIVHFNRSIPPEKAKSKIKKDGWEPAKIEHLLARAEENQHERRKYAPVMALGSEVKIGEERYSPFLVESGNSRGIGLHPLEENLSKVFRCLAVRKVS